MRMMRVIAVRRAEIVRYIELLQSEDPLAAAGQMVHRRASHAAHADDDRIEFAHRDYAAAVRFRLYRK